MVTWHFLEMPKEMLSAWKNFLAFNLNFFSVPLLLKTFFSPWRRYKLSYEKGLNIGKNLEVFISNLIFRLFGAIIRTCLIFIGLVAEFFIFVLGLVLFFCWILLPFLVVWGLIFGINILI